MPTRANYRQWVARKAGAFHEFTADSSGCGAASLVDSSWPVKSSLSQDDLFKDYFLYWPAGVTANQTRVVATYAPSTGSFTPDQNWSVAPDSATYELHGLVDPDTWHTLINDALKRCLVETEFTVTPVADQTRHSLASAASWLTDPKWVRQVGYLTTTDDRDEIDPFRSRVVRGRAYRDGATVYIDHPGRSFSATETLYVRALKPAYYACAAAASPTTYTQSGLSAEADVAIPPVEWVGYATLVALWEQFGNLLSQESEKKIQVNQREAADAFTRATRENIAWPELTFRTLERWGPRR